MDVFSFTLKSPVTFKWNFICTPHTSTWFISYINDSDYSTCRWQYILGYSLFSLLPWGICSGICQLNELAVFTKHLPRMPGAVCDAEIGKEHSCPQNWTEWWSWCFYLKMSLSSAFLGQTEVRCSLQWIRKFFLTNTLNIMMRIKKLGFSMKGVWH